MSYDNQPIIIEVREFKQKIADLQLKLDDLNALLSDLNTKLILKDMDNAIILISKKAVSLRERLQAAKNHLQQIQNCGDEMDGNTTATEEEEFIETLRTEMPDVFKDIDLNFEQIDKIEALIKEVEATKDIDKMKKAKTEIDDATLKVVESEGLVSKLEAEIIEWDALRKLVKRDEELDEVEAAVKEINQSYGQDRKKMEDQEKKVAKKLEKEKDDTSHLQELMNGIQEYFGEFDRIMELVSELK